MTRSPRWPIRIAARCGRVMRQPAPGEGGVPRVLPDAATPGKSAGLGGCIDLGSRGCNAVVAPAALPGWLQSRRPARDGVGPKVRRGQVPVPLLPPRDASGLCRASPRPQLAERVPPRQERTRPSFPLHTGSRQPLRCTALPGHLGRPDPRWPPRSHRGLSGAGLGQPIDRLTTAWLQGPGPTDG